MIYIDMKGQKVPALGFGTWKLTGDDCVKSVEKALAVGYRHLDTAQIYDNEAEVGKAITASGIDRKDIFLTTKVWTADYWQKGEITIPPTRDSVAVSLDKLQTDYVDLLLVHWPSEEVPLQKILSELKELQDQGRIKTFGVSNFPVALMKEAIEELGFDIACNQVEYHALLSQKPVLDYTRQHGMMLTAYSPLARGSLNDHPVLQKIAQTHGKSVGQIALRWLIEQPGVSAIPKAASEKHIRENFDIFDFALSDTDRININALQATNQRDTIPPWAPDWD